MEKNAQRSKLKKLWQLSWSDKRLLARATMWLAIARIELAVFSFAKVSERIAKQSIVTEDKTDTCFLERLSYAISVAASNVPWRADCFPQTIAAHRILERAGYPSKIHIGVERAGGDELNGHAWLTCGGIVVTGGGDLGRYTELHTFGS